MNLPHARELRKNATDCERHLWLHLRGHRLADFKFRRQQPLGPYIVDFVCFETRCIVEADGGQHSEQAEYDNRRDDWLRSQGFTVLRFWNNDILNNIEGILEVIWKACQSGRASSTPPPHTNPSPARGEGLKSGQSPTPPISHKGEWAKDEPNHCLPPPSRGRGRGRGGRRTMSFPRYPEYKDSGVEWLWHGCAATSSPPPHPLPRKGGGAKESADISPLPFAHEGGGAKDEPNHCSPPPSRGQKYLHKSPRTQA